MLLRKDHETRIVLRDDSGMEALQVGGGGGYALEDDGLTGDQLGLESPIHPLGIKPSGNKLLSAGISDARDAIGAFQALPDGTETCDILRPVVPRLILASLELLIQLLEYLDTKSLRRLGYSSKFLYAFSLSEDLWKTLFLE